MATIGFIDTNKTRQSGLDLTSSTNTTGIGVTYVIGSLVTADIVGVSKTALTYGSSEFIVTGMSETGGFEVKRYTNATSSGVPVELMSQEVWQNGSQLRSSINVMALYSQGLSVPQIVTVVGISFLAQAGYNVKVVFDDTSLMAAKYLELRALYWGESVTLIHA